MLTATATGINCDEFEGPAKKIVMELLHPVDSGQALSLNHTYTGTLPLLTDYKP